MKMVIAGGGTGGHIFPGIAVAKEFLKHDPGNAVLFLGTAKGLERDIVPQEGLPFKTVKVEGLTGKPVGKKIISLMKLPIALGQSLWILLSYKPDIVLGVGGYVAGPVMIAAFLLNIPRIIQEQNLIPGLTNKVLGRLVNGIAISFPESASCFPVGKTQLTGNPIREGLYQRIDEERGVKATGAVPFTIFVFGGSQGAHQINLALIESLDYLREIKGSLHFIHQTGKQDYLLVERGYQEQGFSAQVFPFVYDMPEKYQEADLVICRAGATTVAELTAIGKPAVLIPYPYAAHNHQEINARALKEHGAAELILSRDLTAERLANTIIALWQNPHRLKEMSNKARQMGRPEAARQVVELIYQILKTKKS